MPRPAMDWTGYEYSYLRIIGPGETLTGDARKKWRALCLACGSIHEIDPRDLRKKEKTGRGASCGCLTRQFISEARTTHGMSKHPAYAVWHSMIQRCTEPTHQSWRNYGGRGITVCDRWLHSFENFWSDMGPTYQRGLDLDRRDNSQGYSPENCRWVTRLVNGGNTRSRREVDTPLGRMSVAELSRRTGIGKTTLTYRLNHGCPTDMLLTRPDTRNRFSTCWTAGRDTASSC